MTDSIPRTQIFVDGACIVCDVEIAHYKRIAPQLFDLIDISDPKFNAQDFGLTPEAVNRHLHVRTPTGEIAIGVDAFAHIWSRLPRYAWASRTIQLPLLRHLAGFGYEVFVRVRPWLPRRATTTH